jgi:sec-independent protein translocase protein TatB
MPQVGPLEIMVVAMLALIVFGPEKLPGLLRSVGKTLGELRRMASEVQSDFRSGLEDDPEPPPPTAPAADVPKAGDGGPQ